MANTKKYISLDKLGLYDDKIKKVITDGDAAALKSAKDYVDESLKLYEAAGTAATEAGKVQANLDAEVSRAKAEEARIEGLVTTAQGEVDALEEVVATKAAQADLDALTGKVGTVPEGSTVMDIITNIQENAYDDTQLRADMATELAKKADKTQVATDIAAAVKVEEEARIAAVSGVQGAVDTLSQTHATDKTALEGAIALKADQTTVDAISAVANAAATKVALEEEVTRAKAREDEIAGLVAAETQRATGVEADFKSRIETMEVFWDTTEDKDGVVNKLKEIQDYIASDETGAATMAGNIQENTQAIAAMDEAYKKADATLQGNIDALTGVVNTKAAQSDLEALDGRVEVAEGKITTLEGKVSTVEGKVSTLEGEMDDVQAAVATKVEQEAYNTKIAALEGVDAGLAGRIEALEAKHGNGEGTVESMIATAKQEAIDAAAGDATTKANKALEDAKKYADDEDAKIESEIARVEGVVNTKAAQADLEALGNRVAAEEGKVTTLQTEMDAVEALAAANESAIKALQTASATHATKDELNAVSGRVETLETWHNNFTEASEAEILELFNK